MPTSEEVPYHMQSDSPLPKHLSVTWRALKHAVTCLPNGKAVLCESVRES